MKMNGMYVLLGAVVIAGALILVSQNAAVISTEIFGLSSQSTLVTPPKNPGPATISFDKSIYKPGDTVKVTVTATANSYGTNQISVFKMMFVVNPRYSSMQLQTANAVKQKNNVYTAVFGFKIPVYTFNSNNPFFIIVKAYTVDSQGRSGPITSKIITQTGKTVLTIS